MPTIIDEWAKYRPWVGALTLLMFILGVMVVIYNVYEAALDVVDRGLILGDSISTTQTQWLGAQGIRGIGEFPAEYVEVGNSGVLEYDDGKISNAFGSFAPDPRANFSVTPVFKMGWSSPEITGNVVWMITYQSLLPGENSATATETIIYLNSTVSGTANGIKIEEVELSGMGWNYSYVCIPVKIERLGTNTSDTASGVAQLHGMCVSQILVIE